MSNDRKDYLKLQFSSKTKAIEFALTMLNGGGCVITDKLTGTQRAADEGMLASTISEAGEELRMYVEKLMSENKANKPLYVIIRVVDEIPYFGNLHPFAGQPAYNPLMGFMFSTAHAFGLAPNYTPDKEGFIKLTEDIKNKIPADGDIVDLWGPYRSGGMGGGMPIQFSPAGGPGPFAASPYAFGFADLEAKEPGGSIPRFGDANNVNRTEGADGAIILRAKN